jgi:predicted dehydrogenase
MHANVYGLLPDAEVVAAVDNRPEALGSFTEKFACPGFATLEEALDLADVVDICLPTDLHAEFIIKAAEAGKHVFCEKPMARTVEEAEKMARVCRERNVRLMIGHCIRFWPEYALLKEIVDDQRLGALLSINLTRYGAFPTWSAEQWLADETRAGGGVLDMHIHDTDYAHYLLGSPDKIVSCGTVDRHGPSHVFTTMQFGSTIAHLEGGWNLPPKTPFKMAFRAIFERGAAIMDAGPMTIYEDGQDPTIPTFDKMAAEGGGNLTDLGGYFVELQYFIDCLESGKPFEVVTPESSLQSLKTVFEEIRQIKGS